MSPRRSCRASVSSARVSSSRAGLWVLALVVTGLHFVIAIGLTGTARRLPGPRVAQLHVEVVYVDGLGVLRLILEA